MLGGIIRSFYVVQPKMRATLINYTPSVAEPAEARFLESILGRPGWVPGISMSIARFTNPNTRLHVDIGEEPFKEEMEEKEGGLCRYSVRGRFKCQEIGR